ncbi:MAG TPA: hypothetical protein VFQ23_03350, partial [Anaerolineales bacterium]|nr:hypothetical protein [Anaerolineales bacterium]
MNKLAHSPHKLSAYIIVVAIYAAYVAVFVLYHEQVGDVIASSAIVPIISASWYFGIAGGILTALFSIAVNIIVQALAGISYSELLTTPSTIIGSGALIITAIVVGRLASLTRERSEALAKLEALEENNQTHTKFLELLNEITGTALEAEN